MRSRRAAAPCDSVTEQYEWVSRLITPCDNTRYGHHEPFGRSALWWLLELRGSFTRPRSPRAGFPVQGDDLRPRCGRGAGGSTADRPLLEPCRRRSQADRDDGPIGPGVGALESSTRGSARRPPGGMRSGSARMTRAPSWSSRSPGDPEENRAAAGPRGGGHTGWTGRTFCALRVSTTWVVTPSSATTSRTGSNPTLRAMASEALFMEPTMP